MLSLLPFAQRKKRQPVVLNNTIRWNWSQLEKRSVDEAFNNHLNTCVLLRTQRYLGWTTTIAHVTTRFENNTSWVHIFPTLRTSMVFAEMCHMRFDQRFGMPLSICNKERIKTQEGNFEVYFWCDAMIQRDGFKRPQSRVDYIVLHDVDHLGNLDKWLNFIVIPLWLRDGCRVVAQMSRESHRIPHELLFLKHPRDTMRSLFKVVYV